MLPFLISIAIGVMASSRLSAGGIVVLSLLVPLVDGVAASLGGSDLLLTALAVLAVLFGYNLGLVVPLLRALTRPTVVRP